MTGIFGQEFWDEVYRSRSQVWSGEPNPHLVGQASELGAGRALDAGSVGVTRRIDWLHEDVLT